MHLSDVKYLKIQKSTIMLLPDSIHPQNSIYYNGAVVLKILQATGTISLGDLYIKVKAEYNMSFPILLLSLDWLFLISVAIINKKGEVELCS